MSETVARYLLAVIIGVVVLETAGEVRTGVPLGWATLACVGAFALAIGLGQFAPESEDESAGSTASKRLLSARGVTVVLVGLLIVGGLLRADSLGAQSFWFDEAISANAAIAVLEKGTPTFPSEYTYWRAFPHTLLMAASMALLGGGEAAARLPSVVFGLATIATTYWLGREVGTERIGLLAAALVTVATWEIAWSRQARMYQQFQFLYTLTLVLLLTVERTRPIEKRTVVALVAVGTGAALTHRVGFILLPIAVVYLGSIGVADRRLSVGTLGGALVASLMLVIAVIRPTGGFPRLLVDLLSTDTAYGAAYVDWLSSEFSGVFYLGVIGAAVTFYRGWTRAGIALVLAVVPPAWVLSASTDLFATRYLYFAVPVLFVWAAVTVDFAAIGTVDRVASSAPRRWVSERVGVESADELIRAGAACTVAVGLVTVLVFGGGFTVAPQSHYELGVNAPQPEFAGAYEYVNDHREPGDVIVAGWTAPGLYYAGGVDYWLAHPLLGQERDWTVNGVDRYAGAEPIRTARSLEAVIETHDRGWVVLDAVVMRRLDDETVAVLERRASLEASYGELYVYAWDNTAATGG
ncbi:glycosyltransferase family 39 protein [Natrinema caseinilyticum]|uniref:glycosyltransferase family 39 protein n=1 Tax=Natrinema caseinilyticum TaxID=2961570 RepID=UPI0020C35161|nr:glycosyltransferase family 39 protein [Natrinema caseinilyticum]